MNSHSSQLKVCHHLHDDEHTISEYKAERFELKTPNGKSIADVGCEPILHMRNFQVSFSSFFFFLSVNTSTTNMSATCLLEEKKIISAICC